MREQERRRLDAAGRLPMRSPGRPPVAGREERQRFWLAIAKGMPSEDAGIEAGVSPAVGTRWFRDSGGIRSISLARYRGQADRPDPAAVAGPPRTDRWGHTSLNAGVLTRHSLGDRQPEPLPLLPPRHRRPARRPHRPPACSVQPTPLLLSHRNPRSPGVAT